MIVDIHTHIFPPRMVHERARLALLDAGFAEIYANPDARMATAADLLASMDQAGVDVSVACGFWWTDRALAEEHASYILDVARDSGGRLVPFVPLPPANAPAETWGCGEVRETSAASIRLDGRPVLVHCSEEVGHAYPGKGGGLSPGELWRLLEDHPGGRVIAAHWGGGFPFHGLMPEVREIIDSGRVLFDTAASAYLYRPEVFRIAFDLVGRQAVAWGSDFPLRPQERDRQEIEAGIIDGADRKAVLGGNAARFLGLAREAV